jgi:hypothetical protein
MVNNLHSRGTRGSPWPAKANPPLIVDADTILARSVALQRLKPVAPESAQVIAARCGVEDDKSFRGLPREALECADELAICERLRPLVPKAKYHCAQDNDLYALRQA